MSNIHGKLTPSDDFWDEKASERKFTEHLDSEIRRMQGAIGLAEKMMALRASPGWQPFLEALEGCRQFRRQELELCAGTDSEVRILQGRVREITAILTLMTQTEQRTQVLAGHLTSLQERKKALVRPDGKVQPTGAVS